MKIAVGSKNPAKLEATLQAFEKVWPEDHIEIEGFEVDSEVSKQPMSFEESIQGATNRAKKAMEKMDADFGVGLEGGIEKIGNKYFESGWIVISDKKGQLGIGSSALTEIPDKMMKRIHEGMELGHVDDEFFQVTDSKTENGHFGLMTKNIITRVTAYKDGVIMALIPFIHPQLFDYEPV